MKRFVLHAIDVVLLFTLARTIYQTAGLARTADGGFARFGRADAGVMAFAAALIMWLSRHRLASQPHSVASGG